MNNLQNMSNQEKSPLVVKIYELMHCLENINNDPKVDSLCDLEDWKALLINLATYKNEEKRNQGPQMTRSINKILNRLPIIENHLNNRVDVTKITNELKTLFKSKLNTLLIPTEPTLNRPNL